MRRSRSNDEVKSGRNTPPQPPRLKTVKRRRKQPAAAAAATGSEAAGNLSASSSVPMSSNNEPRPKRQKIEYQIGEIIEAQFDDTWRRAVVKKVVKGYPYVEVDGAVGIFTNLNLRRSADGGANWKEEENARLFDAVAEYGANWNKIKREYFSTSTRTKQQLEIQFIKVYGSEIFNDVVVERKTAPPSRRGRRKAYGFAPRSSPAAETPAMNSTTTTTNRPGIELVALSPASSSASAHSSRTHNAKRRREGGASARLGELRRKIAMMERRAKDTNKRFKVHTELQIEVGRLHVLEYKSLLEELCNEHIDNCVGKFHIDRNDVVETLTQVLLSTRQRKIINVWAELRRLCRQLRKERERLLDYVKVEHQHLASETEKINHAYGLRTQKNKLEALTTEYVQGALEHGLSERAVQLKLKSMKPPLPKRLIPIKEKRQEQDRLRDDLRALQQQLQRSKEDRMDLDAEAKEIATLPRINPGLSAREASTIRTALASGSLRCVRRQPSSRSSRH
eukprot:jgi/Bigna1/78298/fgenesh1_pg.53_\